MVVTTAGIQVKMAVWVPGGYRMQMVFLKKWDERCNGIEYKAMAQGVTQKPGTDFSNMGTFTPVGFHMGIPRVGFSHTAPVPVYTVTRGGLDPYRCEFDKLL